MVLSIGVENAFSQQPTTVGFQVNNEPHVFAGLRRTISRIASPRPPKNRFLPHQAQESALKSVLGIDNSQAKLILGSQIKDEKYQVASLQSDSPYQRILKESRLGHVFSEEEYESALEIHKLVIFWENTKFGNGEPVLQHKNLLYEKNTLVRLEVDRLKIWFPENGIEQATVDGLCRLAEDMNQIIGGSMDSPGEICALLVPSSLICPRDGAIKDGNVAKLIIQIEDPKYPVNFVHEYVHARMMQLFGNSTLDALVEGSAQFFVKRKFPKDIINDYYLDHYYGIQEIRRVATDPTKQMPLSHTGLLEVSGGVSYPEVLHREFAYKFGGFLVEFLIQKYGQVKFLEVYKKSCSPDLYDDLTAKPLLENGQKMAKQREILAQCLIQCGIDPQEVITHFDKFMKEIYASKGK